MKINAFLFVIFILFVVLHQNVFSQQKSEEEKYTSHEKLILSSGMLFNSQWQTNDYISIEGVQMFINLSYRYDDESFDQTYPQIGLTNEFGIKNFSIFVKAGPKLLLKGNLAVDVHAGLTLVLAKGIEFSGGAFIAFVGVNPSYSIPLSDKLNLEVEGGLDISLFNNKPIISFGIIGVSWNFNK
ncbi:MAG: hypothetical protein M1480_04425 [Bacteroidetes bacterium]|nr:hypothetical protein [Bacteroidota bacterium]